MKITHEELKASYRQMPDEELLALDPAELTETARQCYHEEVQERGLEAEAAAALQSASADEGAEPFVVVEICHTEDEALDIQSALTAENIPAHIGDPNLHDIDPPGPGIGRYPVAVPASFAGQARQVLNAQPPDAIVVAARYENGVFRPVGEITLEEGTVVEVHVPAGSIL